MNNSSKTLARLAALVVAAYSFSASALTIYISGAPAFRQVGTTAIQNVLNANAATYSHANPTIAQSGSNVSLTSANAVNFYNAYLSDGTAVTVKVSYTGSSAGIQSVASGKTVQFLPDTATGTSNPEPNGNTNAAQYEAHVPDFTLSDDFQGSTPWVGTNSLTGTPVTYSNLSDDVDGILPYVFVASKGAPTRLNNINPQQAQILWKNGQISLAQLTGLSSDEQTEVFATGRDQGSGLRTILLSETGIGVLTNIVQYQPQYDGSGNVNNLITFPPATVNGVYYAADGDGGYSSFTPLKTALTANGYPSGLASFSGTSGGGYLLTALAYPDYVSIASSVQLLSYNGVALGAVGAGSGTVGAGLTASPALAEGQYTFWSYIHVHYLSSLSGKQLLAKNQIGTRIHDHDATVLVSDVKVTRNAPDGGNVFTVGF